MKSGKNLRVLTDSNLHLSVVRNSQNLKSPYLTQPEVSVDLADSQSEEIVSLARVIYTPQQLISI